MAVKNRKEFAMNKTLHQISGIIFALIALAHFARFVFRWEILLEGVSVPVWASGVATVIFGILAGVYFFESRE